MVEQVSTYIMLSTLIFFIFGIFWRKDGFTNFLIKLVLLVMGVMGIFLWLHINGFLIQIPH